MIPTIVITTPLLDADHEDIPSITVTRNVDERDYNPTDFTMDSMIVNNSHVSAGGLYPPSLFIAARSSNPIAKKNVESFIQSRLDSFEPTPPRSCQCTSLVKSIEELLECPVCRDRVGREVYQCHRGHIMCQTCRARLLTCPVCRSLLTLPAIRNRAMERLASML